MSRTGIIVLGLLGVILWAMGAAAAQEAPMEVTVKRGDTLYRICNIYLEDFRNWPKIAEYNGLAAPYRLSPGQRIKLPVHLLQGVPMVGRVVFAKGRTRIRPTAEHDWRPIVIDAPVQQRDWLETGAESALEIQFDNGDTLYLPANTTIQMTTLRAKSLTQRIYRILLKAGRVISNIREITGNGSRFEIQTPSAITAVRGTEFRVSCDAARTSRCEVLKGRVEVAAQEDRVVLDQFEGTLIAQNEPPQPPRKLLPAPQPLKLKSLYREFPLQIESGKIPGAATYRMQVARDKEIRDVLKDLTVDPRGASGGSFMIIDIPDGSYHLRLTAMDEEGIEGRPSEPQILKVRTNPRTPVIKSSLEGTLFFEKKASFEWLNVQDAAKYHAQIATDPGFTVLTVDQTDISKVSYQTMALNPQSYYFRLSSVAADGYQGVWSDPLPFIVTSGPPVAAPPEMDDNEITLAWSDMGDSFKYHFQLSENRDFANLTMDRILNTPKITIPRPDTPGTYYTRVSTVAPNGQEGSFALPQSFQVEPKPNWFHTLAAIGLQVAIFLTVMF